MSDTQFEEYVSLTAAAYRYPPTPNVAGALGRRRLRAAADSADRLRPARRSLRWAGALLLLLALLLGLLAIPPVRAAVLRFLRIGAIEINLLEEGEPLPTPAPAMEAISIVDVGRSLDRAAAAFPAPLHYPSALPPPDQFFAQELLGAEPVITMLWLGQPETGAPQIALSQITIADFGLKWSSGEQVQQVLSPLHALPANETAVAAAAGSETPTTRAGAWPAAITLLVTLFMGLGGFLLIQRSQGAGSPLEGG